MQDDYYLTAAELTELIQAKGLRTAIDTVPAHWISPELGDLRTVWTEAYTAFNTNGSFSQYALESVHRVLNRCGITGVR